MNLMDTKRPMNLMRTLSLPMALGAILSMLTARPVAAQGEYLAGYLIIPVS